MGELSAYTEWPEIGAHGGITLQAVGLQPRQRDTGFGVRGESHELVPIGCGAPVTFDTEAYALAVTAGGHRDDAAGGPFGFSTEMAHEGEGHVDVGTRNDGSFQVQRKSLLHGGPHHEKGGNVLRTHVCRQAEGSAFQLPPIDAERRKAFSACHEMVFTGTVGEVGSQEAHGRTCSHDVDRFGPEREGTLHDEGVIAVGRPADVCFSTQRTEQESTIAETF